MIQSSTFASAGAEVTQSGESHTLMFTVGICLNGPTVNIDDRDHDGDAGIDDGGDAGMVRLSMNTMSLKVVMVMVMMVMMVKMVMMMLMVLITMKVAMLMVMVMAVLIMSVMTMRMTLVMMTIVKSLQSAASELSCQPVLWAGIPLTQRLWIPFLPTT